LEIGRQPTLRRHLKASDAAAAGLLPESESDRDLDHFIRRTAFSFYHPAGTCAIGQVVDHELRVLGVERLRVADTSIMPTLIAGNTNAPAIMIGEKAADLICSGRPA
jgi:choline dehydrogenase-like flavoprotein